MGKLQTRARDQAHFASWPLLSSRVLPWVLIFALSLFAFRALFEDDIFMQIRAGEEILKSGSVPGTDTWSFTAYGTPWINYQWLSMVLFRVLWGIGGAPALVYSRVAATLAIFALLLWGTR